MNSRHISPRSATLVFGLGTLVSHGFGLSLVPAMLPRIEEDFQSGYGVLGVAVATGLIAYAVGSVLASPILRVVPTRGLLVGTFAVTGVGFLVTAFASSPIYIAVAVTILGLSAPVSWTATMHVARETIAVDSLSMVSAGASGGASVGVLLNGVLVRTSGSIHTWRVSFLVAAIVAVAVIVVALAVFRQPIAKPQSSGIALLAVFRRVLADPSGRLIVATSAVSGITVFTLATFLTATAIDEMKVSDTAAAILLVIAGLVGVGSALGFGRVGDRRTPTFAITVVMSLYAMTLAILAVGWSYPVLVGAVIGYGILNGPVWGLMGAAANRRFTAELTVGVVSLGLVASAVMGAIGNSVSGVWIENTGSMRGPALMLAVIAIVMALILIRESRRASSVIARTEA